MKKKLGLSDVRPALSLDIRKGVAVFRLGDFRDPKKEVSLDHTVWLPNLNIPLQRGLCWTLRQQQELILSVLKGLTIPKVSLVQTDKGKRSFKVVDGKQRLNAFQDFMLNCFPIQVGRSKYLFDDLGEDCQRELLLYHVMSDLAFEDNANLIPDVEYIKWFNLINFTGTEQDAEHQKFLNSKLKERL